MTTASEKRESATRVKETSVDKAVSHFRDLFNDSGPVFAKTLNNTRKWNIVCSAMDVIENTEAATKAYEEAREPATRGEHFLIIYGLFQSMYVQQDALKHLFVILEKEFTLNETPELKRIRDIRNDCVGHPADRSEGVEAPRSTLMYSDAISKTEFTLIRYFHGNKKGDRIVIRPLELIAKQRELMSEQIRRATSILVEKVNRHRQKFCKKPLQDHLKNYGRFLKKLQKNLLLPGHEKKQADAAYTSLRKSLTDLHRSLRSRRINEDVYIGLDSSLETLRSSFTEVGEFLSGKPIQTTAAQSALTDAANDFNDIYGMLGEIDTEYNEPFGEENDDHN